MECSKQTRSQLAFFGVSPENVAETRVAIFTQIHEIVFYGNGGYTWHDVYNFPIWLRKFTHKKIADHLQKESQAIENSKGSGKGHKNMVNSDGTVNTPDFKAHSQQPQSPPKYK
jgi:hypothetical protein